MIAATLMPNATVAKLDSFIARWTAGDGGQERANYAPFLSELCDALEVQRPDPASHDTALNAYVFERAVIFREPDGSTARGRIDLYKRGSFVLEAKQSRKPGKPKELQSSLFDPEPEETAPRGRRTASRAWDVLMLNARQQAEQYAKALPTIEGWPPFLIVCDVGHCFEIYADFTGQGKNYAQFPDRQGFRVYLEELQQEEVRERLRLIWLDPQKLDPAKITARVTREIAERLAKVSKHLEDTKHDPETVALFLMRCLFTMFAQSVELLPKDSFSDVLKKCIDDPSHFCHRVEQLWAAMDQGGFAYAIERDVRKFNGYLFKSRSVLPLPKQEIGELLEAARRDWRKVEPAIFGTLLEQALNPAERKKLGAHYTPRAYVERLVVATILEPLKAEWANVQATAEAKREGDPKGAAAVVQAFHTKLCGIRILDPACGTGNFLYVSLELMKRLEGEVLEALASLAGAQEALHWLQGQTIDPHQFLGLEVNPRAAAIAELVLWIGYLQWHFRTRGGMPPEPILRDFQTIQVADAVLAWDSKDLARDKHARPIARTDTEGNQVEVYRYKNPKRPRWPDADYIVGNPPFIGGKDIRGRMGEDYAKALWAAHPHMNESADYVMYWWDFAAELLTLNDARLKRFGLVTTNSLSQVFQRRVMEKHLGAKKPVSLLMAIPDHPWTKATRDAAAVRIAMTVAEAGAHEGRLFEVTKEEGLDTDAPNVELRETRGKINSDLTVGADVTALSPLKANAFLSSRGVVLHGAGFIVTPAEAGHLGLRRRPGLESHIRHYRNGRDLTGTPRGVMVIDLFGLDADEVRKRFPEVYQHILATVKPDRDANRDKDISARWWLFGRTRDEIRPALKGLPRYIATVETAKHRIFQFLDASILPDNKLLCVGLADAYHLGVLSSRSHIISSLRAGGWLGVGNDPVYVKSKCFDPFPFPDPPETLKARIRATAEELDALRKQVQAEYPGLTLTQLYNVLEKLRAGEKLDAEDEAIKTQGLLLILKELHERLDALVAEAYGWPENLSDNEILEKLVALNAERAAEERRGLVRWLRPEYQRARAGIAPEQRAKEAEEQLEAQLVIAAAKAQKPAFPTSDLERTAAVFAALTEASTPLDAQSIAAKFRQGQKIEPSVARILAAFARMGQFHTGDGERFTQRRGG
ncbi:MAG: class I SAM-dependent DNA methyltransferase [Pseudomonadota bacterium]|nr:class I SAM-dependent DNA methyltransferase [Pseudomonadota bacterium]